MSIEALYQHYLSSPRVTTDTRKIEPGSIFFALRGDHFDGNAFARQALDAGATLAVVSDPDLKGDCFFQVNDTLQALQDLATFHRRKLRIPVLGITGTNGKTTTKELVACVLATQYVTHATQGNFNNHIGVPLTILSTPPDAEILVCEMGANHIGEIAALCQIAQPTHGLITNIGRAHLEGFGSFEGVKKAKSELYWYLENHGGIVFINMDDQSLASMASLFSRKITFGLSDANEAEYHFNYVANIDQPGFTIHSRTNPTRITSSMFGSYNAYNALAAYAVGHYFKVPDEKIAAAIQSYIPGNNRSQLLQHHGCTIIKDAYNANPSSMELAITAFDAQFSNGLLVLGDMKELGETSQSAHQKIIEIASATSAVQIFLVGPEFCKAFENGDTARIRLFQHVDDLKQQWNWSACSGKGLLLKGSRSMRLEELLNS